MNAERPSLTPALLAIAALAAFVWLFLYVDKQWEVATLAVGAVAAVLLARRRGWSRRADASFSAHQTTAATAALIAGVIVVGLFHGNHFALLMLSTVMLYAVACFGLTVQFGYAGVVNFAGA